jgi:hypothetical protein
MAVFAGAQRDGSLEAIEQAIRPFSIARQNVLQLAPRCFPDRQH